MRLMFLLFCLVCLAAEETAAQAAKRIKGILNVLPMQTERRLVLGQNLGHGADVLRQEKTLLEDPRLGGKKPLMIGIDYGIDELDSEAIRVANRSAIAYHKAGGWVTISMHPHNPIYGGESLRRCEKMDVNAILKPGTEANLRWVAIVDKVGKGLLELKQAGVPVLWRPFHEANGNWFWWGTPFTGPDGFIRLWKDLKTRLDAKKLDNLIWIYSVNCVVTPEITPIDAGYPGDAWVDATGLDIYTDGWDAERIREDLGRLKKLGKPVGVSEYGPKPNGLMPMIDVADLPERLARACPEACYILFWHDFTEKTLRFFAVQQKMSLSQHPGIGVLMEHSKVLRLGDQLPEGGL
jgi:mannan endo-1,4-beta-mannosidase